MLALLMFAGVAYAYFGYPLLLLLLVRIAPKRELDRWVMIAPKLSIIITAHNEAGVIKAKLENTLMAIAAYSKEKGPRCQIIVASDRSTDGTNEIVREFADRHVILLAQDIEPGGKERAQKLAVESASADIIVFTDAKAELDEFTLIAIAEPFQDSSVGAVSSTDVVTGESGEGLYVRYEMLLRKLESSFWSLVGLSGSCFAVRRELAQQIAIDKPSDFGLLLIAVRSGLRGVHAEKALCFYQAASAQQKEFDRKVRTVLRGITTLCSNLEVLSPFRYGIFSWQIFSHKLMRWLVPWMFLSGWLTSGVGAKHSGLSLMLFLLSTSFLLLASCGIASATLRQRPIFRIPAFLALSNLAVALAWIDYFRGRRVQSWKPTDR